MVPTELGNGGPGDGGPDTGPVESALVEAGSPHPVQPSDLQPLVKTACKATDDIRFSTVGVTADISRAVVYDHDTRDVLALPVTPRKINWDRKETIVEDVSIVGAVQVLGPEYFAWVRPDLMMF